MIAALICCQTQNNTEKPGEGTDTSEPKRINPKGVPYSQAEQSTACLKSKIRNLLLGESEHLGGNELSLSGLCVNLAEKGLTRS